MHTTRELNNQEPDTARGDGGAARCLGIGGKPSGARSEESGTLLVGLNWVAAAAAGLGGLGLFNAGHGSVAGLAFAGSLYLAAVAMGYRGRTYRSVVLLRVSATRRRAA